MASSQEYYNQIASKYRHVSSGRARYLDAIDDLVIEHSKKDVHYLDIGAGDGVRSLKIAEGIRAKSVDLVDNSSKITSNITDDEKVTLYILDILDLNVSKKYGLITCLWNVLGHVGDRQARLEFFHKIGELLTPDGLLFLDVNNRYNINHYGFSEVHNNLERDIKKTPRSGWFTLGSGVNTTEVYVHAPFEIERMASEAGLKVNRVNFIDYNTGEIRNTFFEGQLFYTIQHDA